jgi:3-hydroxy-3-methylglutaryl CoA synthase
MAEDQNRSLQDKFMLRMPDGMRERIAAAAAANNRSMNSEIVATLEKHYPSMASIDDLIRQTNELAKLNRSGEYGRDLQTLNDALRTIIMELMKDYGKAGNPAYQQLPSPKED